MTPAVDRLTVELSHGVHRAFSLVAGRQNLGLLSLTAAPADDGLDDSRVGPGRIGAY